MNETPWVNQWLTSSCGAALYLTDHPWLPINGNVYHLLSENKSELASVDSTVPRACWPIYECRKRRIQPPLPPWNVSSWPDICVVGLSDSSRIHTYLIRHQKYWTNHFIMITRGERDNSDRPRVSSSSKTHLLDCICRSMHLHWHTITASRQLCTSQSDRDIASIIMYVMKKGKFLFNTVREHYKQHWKLLLWQSHKMHNALHSFMQRPVFWMGKNCCGWVDTWVDR